MLIHTSENPLETIILGKVATWAKGSEAYYVFEHYNKKENRHSN